MNSDLAESYVESLGNRLFYCKGDDKLFMSKSLLELLDFDPEQMALEMVKYRTSLHE